VPSGPLDDYEAKGAPDAAYGNGGMGSGGGGAYQTHADFKATTTYSNNAKVNNSMNEQEETDDLLQWSMALDYDDYASGWANIGTSAPSDSNNAYS